MKQLARRPARHVYYAALVALASLLVWGCSPKEQAAPDIAEQPTPQAMAPQGIHVAFAGGGWRAHSGHSGWILNLLKESGVGLDGAFANVDTVASNSGGSWFNTMLSFSGSFVTAIEAPNALETWASTGWLGQQEALFNAADCHGVSGDAFTACVFEMYAPEGATYWNSVVEGLVFNDYPIQSKLNGARQPWAKDKSLLLAATLVTRNTVLGQQDDTDEQYYQACLSPSTPELGGDDGSSCSDGSKALVSPVSFSSLPSGSSLTAPPFFLAVQTESTGRHFNMGYTEAAFFDPSTAYTTVANPLVNDEVPVMVAAAASSAAAGFGASHDVTGDWEAAYLASDEALSFQLLDGTVQFVDVDGHSVHALAEQKAVRIADGGPADNSGVAQIVRFLQLNGQGNGFNIVAFDNVEGLFPATKGSGAQIGEDLANLFGEALGPNGDQYCSGPNGTGTCITVPDLQIFDVHALESTESIWSFIVKSSEKVKYALIYTPYEVVTVDNANFGISAGTHGTLHAFTLAFEGAATAPQNISQDGDFKAYGQMIDLIHRGLQESNSKGKTGREYLLEAFGLNP